MPVWGGKRDTDCVAESSLLEFLHQENPSLKNKASTLRPPISYTHTITRTRDGMCTGRVAVCPSYAPLTPLLRPSCHSSAPSVSLSSLFFHRRGGVWCGAGVMSCRLGPYAATSCWTSAGVRRLYARIWTIQPPSCRAPCASRSFIQRLSTGRNHQQQRARNFVGHTRCLTHRCTTARQLTRPYTTDLDQGLRLFDGCSSCSASALPCHSNATIGSLLWCSCACVCVCI